VKQAMAEEVIYLEGRYPATVEYIPKPDLQVLYNVFNTIPGTSGSKLHSDDIITWWQCEDGLLGANIDISQCDLSQTEAVFEQALRIVPVKYRQVMETLITQCKLDLQIGVGPGKLVFRPTRPVEYSGSVLTTLLNNLASFAISLALLEGVNAMITGTRTMAMVRDALALILPNLAWKVEIEFWRRYEDAQLLKHSPCLTEQGDWYPVLNLGVIFRAMGRTRFDLPGSGPVEARARDFMWCWTKGLVHAGEHDITHALRAKYTAVDRNVNGAISKQMWIAARMDATHFVCSSTTQHPQLLSTSLVARYECGLGDLAEAVSLIEASNFGDILSCQLMNQALKKDYGVWNDELASLCGGD
jgi:hypothetical protein